jgi:hypothetical protein
LWGKQALTETWRFFVSSWLGALLICVVDQPIPTPNFSIGLSPHDVLDSVSPVFQLLLAGTVLCACFALHIWQWNPAEPFRPVRAAVCPSSPTI